MLILVKIFGKYWFPLKILALVEVFKKSWFSSIFSKNLDFGHNFRKCGFWSKFSENLNSGQNFWKSRFWSKFFEFSIYLQSWFWPKFSIIEFCQKFRKSWFWSKFIKFLIWVKIFGSVDFGQNFRKILISVKIFWKSWHWSKFSKNLYFSQDFRKSRFWSKFFKISISVKILGILDLCSILILAKIFKLSNFVKNCRKLSRFCQNFLKSCQNFWKCWFWSKFSENIDFSQNILKILALVEVFEKSWF